jgi:hypothetical protein
MQLDKQLKFLRMALILSPPQKFAKQPQSILRYLRLNFKKGQTGTAQSPVGFQNATPIVLKYIEVEVKLRPIVSRPVRLGVRHPSGTRDQYFFLLEIFFRQLRVLLFCSALSDERTGL